MGDYAPINELAPIRDVTLVGRDLRDTKDTTSLRDVGYTREIRTHSVPVPKIPSMTPGLELYLDSEKTRSVRHPAYLDAFQGQTGTWLHSLSESGVEQEKLVDYTEDPRYRAMNTRTFSSNV
jgi:hypothetical protein